jgi:hypothetical protein
MAEAEAETQVLHGELFYKIEISELDLRLGGIFAP